MKGYLVVKTWMRDKIEDATASYRWFPTYEEIVNDKEVSHVADSIRVENLIKETDKAVFVEIECESASGHVKTFKTWIPKSAIIENNLFKVA